MPSNNLFTCKYCTSTKIPPYMSMQIVASPAADNPAPIRGFRFATAYSISMGCTHGLRAWQRHGIIMASRSWFLEFLRRIIGFGELKHLLQLRL
jgi:hypothetical protein